MDNYDRQSKATRVAIEAQQPATSDAWGEVMSDTPVLRFRYRNYKGEISDRRVMPMVGKDALTFGSTFHHAAGWNLHGWDVDKNAKRSFRLTDILAWLDDDGNPVGSDLAAENAALRVRVAALEAQIAQSQAERLSVIDEIHAHYTDRI